MPTNPQDAPDGRGETEALRKVLDMITGAPVYLGPPCHAYISPSIPVKDVDRAATELTALKAQLVKERNAAKLALQYAEEAHQQSDALLADNARLRARLAEAEGDLDYLERHVVHIDYEDSETGERAVHLIHGGVNDSRASTVGVGATVRDALRAARRQEKYPPGSQRNTNPRSAI